MLGREPLFVQKMLTVKSHSILKILERFWGNSTSKVLAMYSGRPEFIPRTHISKLGNHGYNIIAEEREIGSSPGLVASQCRLVWSGRSRSKIDPVPEARQVSPEE